MANRSPTEHHNYWGNGFAAYANLPNVAASATQNANLQVGDIAYVPTEGMYVNIVATLGAAVWTLISDVVAAPLDLYVSDINGNDANNGLTPAAALKTVTKAISLVPSEIDQRCIIHIGRHGGTGYAPPSVQARLLRASLYFYGDGAGQAGETGFTVIIAPAAAAAGSGAAAVVSAAVLVLNAHRGQTIEILSGAATGDRRTIRDNTTTTFTPCRNFSAAVAPGDSYRIVDPDVIWLFPAATTTSPILVANCSSQLVDGGIETYSPGVYFVNLKWAGAASTAGYTIEGSRVCFVNVVSDSVISNTQLPRPGWYSSDIGLGQDQQTTSTGFAGALVGPFLDLGVVSANAWRGWTIAYRGVATSSFLVSTTIHGTLVVPRIALIGNLAVANIVGGNFFGDLSGSQTIQVSNGACLFVQAAPILLVNCASVNGAIIALSGGRVLGLLSVTITNTTGACLEAYGVGSVIAQVASTVTGTSAGTFGAVCGAGGQIQFQSVPGVLGPAGADLSIDYVTSVAAATLDAIYAAISSPDNTCIMRSG